MQGIRRGHLKFYILRLLIEGRRTGYGLMKAIEAETGFWKPSAGSLYPLLSSMKEQGLIVEIAETDTSKRWHVTDAGRNVYDEAAESKRELFDSMRRSLVVFSKVDRLSKWQEGRQDFRTLGPLFMDVHDALWALPPLTTTQETEARRILEETIEDLNRLRSIASD